MIRNVTVAKKKHVKNLATIRTSLVHVRVVDRVRLEADARAGERVLLRQLDVHAVRPPFVDGFFRAEKSHMKIRRAARLQLDFIPYTVTSR